MNSFPFLFPIGSDDIVAIVNPQQIKKDKYAEQLFRINEEAYRGQRLLEKAKLAWTERATAEMNKLKDEQTRLQKKLEDLLHLTQTKTNSFQIQRLRKLF